MQKAGKKENLFLAATTATLLVSAAFPFYCAAQSASVAVTPSADTFLRALAPASNYGGAGALSVSGSSATNGAGQTNGIFDSLVRFPMSNIVASLDAALGETNWVITRATLRAVELGAPANSLFNRGVGAFEIRWIGSDAWVEGTGTPNAPATDGVSYQNLASILNPTLDASLGQFTNNGVDGPVSFELALVQSFLADVRSGTDMGLYLTAASPTVGFTFDSRSFSTVSERPTLEIVALANPNPRIDYLYMTGGTANISFNMASNWTYQLEYVDSLPVGGTGSWLHLATMPAQPLDLHVVTQDTVTNLQRFYRLSATR